MKLSVRGIVITTVGILGTVAAWAYPFGPPNGYTPAPGDRPGVACTACHRDFALNSTGGNVKVTFPNGLTYTPGQTQNLVITVTDSTAAVYGFEMTARLDNAPNTQQAGSFTAAQGQKVICSNNQVQPATGCGGSGIQWIEHSQPYLTNTITVQWTPPSAGAGNVHIYVASNAGNGDNTFRGDHIYSANYVLVPASSSTTNVPLVSSVVNAASRASTIQSGSWVTITGSNFATTTATWDTSIINNVFPTTLGGVTVAIDGRPAPVSFVSPTQINVLAPANSVLGPVNVVVSNANGSSAPASVQLTTASPGFFTFSQNQGRYVAAIVLEGASSFQYLAPQGLLGSSVQSRPAKPGDTISLYGTGFGPTTTPLNPELAQSVAFPLAHTGADITTALCTVTIGGQPAQVLFAGLVGPGVYQINAVVPQVANGDQAVAMTLLSGPSITQQVFIPVQQ